MHIIFISQLGSAATLEVIQSGRRGGVPRQRRLNVRLIAMTIMQCPMVYGLAGASSEEDNCVLKKSRVQTQQRSNRMTDEIHIIEQINSLWMCASFMWEWGMIRVCSSGRLHNGLLRMTSLPSMTSAFDVQKRNRKKKKKQTSSSVIISIFIKQRFLSRIV